METHLPEEVHLLLRKPLPEEEEEGFHHPQHLHPHPLLLQPLQVLVMKILAS
jgi:hypothetical protein